MDAAALAKPLLMLFVVLDPIGILPYYQTIIYRVPEEERPKILERALVAALAMLLSFAILGDYMFRLLGVTIGDFQVAAGLLLLIYAIANIFELELGSTTSSSSVAIFPLATPLLAGPGAITALIYIKYQYGLPVAILVSVVNIAIAYPIMASSSIILRLLGKHGSLFVDKFMNLILAGFAVSIMREGITLLLSSSG